LRDSRCDRIVEAAKQILSCVRRKKQQAHIVGQCNDGAIVWGRGTRCIEAHEPVRVSDRARDHLPTPAFQPTLYTGTFAYGQWTSILGLLGFFSRGRNGTPKMCLLQGMASFKGWIWPSQRSLLTRVPNVQSPMRFRIPDHGCVHGYGEGQVLARLSCQHLHTGEQALIFPDASASLLNHGCVQHS
jgi:hypothetical protein